MLPEIQLESGECEIWKFSYINYRKELSLRRVKPNQIWFGSTQYHPDPQWIMTAYDLDKEEKRDFAMKDMTDVKVMVI